MWNKVIHLKIVRVVQLFGECLTEHNCWGRKIEKKKEWSFFLSCYPVLLLTWNEQKEMENCVTSWGSCQLREWWVHNVNRCRSKISSLFVLFFFNFTTSKPFLLDNIFLSFVFSRFFFLFHLELSFLFSTLQCSKEHRVQISFLLSHNVMTMLT